MQCIKRNLNSTYLTMTSHFINNLVKIRPPNYKNFASFRDFYGRNLFFNACLTENLQLAYYFAEIGCSINEQDYYGNTPLEISVQLGNLELVKFLIRNIEDLDKTKLFYLISLACDNNDDDIVDLLMAHIGIDIISSIPEIDKVNLLKSNIFNNNLNIVSTILYHYSPSILDILNKENYPPLFIACQNGFLEIASLLHSKGCDINQKNVNNITPLMVAAEKGLIHIVNWLLSLGVNTQNEYNDSKIAIPLSALHIACIHKNYEVFIKLFSYSNNLIIISNNIWLAANYGCVDIFKWLIEYSKIHYNDFLEHIITLPGPNNKSPLQVACENNHKVIVDIINENIKSNSSLEIPFKKEMQQDYFALFKHRNTVLPSITEKIQLQPITEGIIIEENFILATHEIINIAIFKSSSISASPCPTIIYFPGTGFSASNCYFPHVVCSNLAANSKKFQVICLSHKLAPEYDLLTIKEHCWDSIQLLIRQHSRFNIDLDNLIFSGYSSGGNIATSMAIKAQNETNFNLVGLLLIAPFLDLSRKILNSNNQGQLAEEEFHKRKDAYNGDAKFAPKRLITKRFVDDIIHRCSKGKKGQELENFVGLPEISPCLMKKIDFKHPVHIFCGNNDYFYPDAVGFNGIASNCCLHVYESQNHSQAWNSSTLYQDVSKEADKCFQLEPLLKSDFNFQETLRLELEKIKNTPNIDKKFEMLTYKGDYDISLLESAMEHSIDGIASLYILFNKKLKKEILGNGTLDAVSLAILRNQHDLLKKILPYSTELNLEKVVTCITSMLECQYYFTTNKEQFFTTIKIIYKTHPDIVNISIKDNSNSIFICVCKLGIINIAEWLISKGAYTNKLYLNNNTLLHFACENSQYDIVDLLLKNCADPFRANLKGITPVDIAREKNDAYLENLLKENIFFQVLRPNITPIRTESLKKPLSSLEKTKLELTQNQTSPTPPNRSCPNSPAISILSAPVSNDDSSSDNFLLDTPLHSKITSLYDTLSTKHTEDSLDLCLLTPRTILATPTTTPTVTPAATPKKSRISPTLTATSTFEFLNDNIPSCVAPTTSCTTKHTHVNYGKVKYPFFRALLDATETFELNEILEAMKLTKPDFKNCDNESETMPSPLTPAFQRQATISLVNNQSTGPYISIRHDFKSYDFSH